MILEFSFHDKLMGVTFKKLFLPDKVKQSIQVASLGLLEEQSELLVPRRWIQCAELPRELVVPGASLQTGLPQNTFWKNHLLYQIVGRQVNLTRFILEVAVENLRASKSFGSSGSLLKLNLGECRGGLPLPSHQLSPHTVSWAL